jgi:glutaredoxin-related protein
MAEFIIYTKQSCQYCSDLKTFLIKNNKTFQEIDIYQINSLQTIPFEYHDKDSFFKKLNEIIIWKTFPIVFKNNTFIGGYTETVQYVKKEDAFINL